MLSLFSDFLTAASMLEQGGHAGMSGTLTPGKEKMQRHHNRENDSSNVLVAYGSILGFVVCLESGL